MGRKHVTALVVMELGKIQLPGTAPTFELTITKLQQTTLQPR